MPNPVYLLRALAREENMLKQCTGYILPAVADNEDVGTSPVRRWSCLRCFVYALVFFFFLLFVHNAVLSYLDTRDGNAWPCPYCDILFCSPAVAVRHASASEMPVTNLSHVVFAISGSAATWGSRQQYASLWWRPGETRGHVWLDAPPPTGTWTETPSLPYRISAVNATPYGNGAPAARMARIVVEAYHETAKAGGANGGASRPEAHWFVMGDDDTVFFPDNLVAVLRKYDHREMYYVGAPSESVEQNVMHSYGMAFGGGGLAISYPAAAALAGIMDGCLDRYNNLYGSDERVQACLAELGVPLTREPGFHQLDVRGSANGLLAAHKIAPLVSLHHLDAIDPISPHWPTRMEALRSLIEASLIDPDRTLQQTVCYARGSSYTLCVSVSWGYAVQLHPRVLTPRELEVPVQTFRTWRSVTDGPFVFNTRPAATGPACGPETAAALFYGSIREEIGRNGVNWTVTEYTTEKLSERPTSCTEPGARTASLVQRVQVWAPRLDPAIWKRAPRRQCCQTRQTRGESVLAVRIYECGPTESVYQTVTQ